MPALAYGGHATDVRCNKITIALTRHDNLSVLAVDDADIQHIVALCGRTMCLQCLIQDGELQLIAGDVTLQIRPHSHMSDYAVA